MNTRVTTQKNSNLAEELANVKPTSNPNSAALTRELPRRAARTVGGERIHEQYQLKHSWKKPCDAGPKKGTSKRESSVYSEPGSDDPSTPLKRRKYSEVATGPIDDSKLSKQHDLPAKDSAITVAAVAKDKDLSAPKQHQHRTGADNAAPSRESTNRMHQSDWKIWCASRNFKDGARVNGEKLMSYMTSLKSIVDPVARNCPFTRGRPALDILYDHLGAIQELYREQCAENNTVLHDLDDFLKGDEIEVQLHRFQTEIDELYWKQDGAGTDATKELEQENRAVEWNGEKSLFRHYLAQILRLLWNEHRYLHRGLSWLDITQSRLYLVLDNAFGGLSLNFGEIMLKDLYAVHYCKLQKEQQSHLSSGIAISQQPGQSIEPRARHLLLQRHEDVDICPVGSLAFYLHAVWTSMSSEIQGDGWKQCYLIFTTYMNLPGSIENLEATRKKLVEKVRLLSLDRETMAISTSADPLQDTPPHQTSTTGATRHKGRIVHGALFPSYLSLCKRDIPYKLKYAHTDIDKTVSQPRRSLIIPSTKMQQEIFPFIENLLPGNTDWAQWIENIMMDRDEGTDRAVDWRKGYQELDCAETIRLALVLAHLRKVVLQDYAILTAGDPSELSLSARHHLTKQNSILLSLQFKKFATRLRNASHTDQPAVDVDDDEQIGEPGIPNNNASEVLTAGIAGVSVAHAHDVSVTAGVDLSKASAVAPGPAAPVIAGCTSTDPIPISMEMIPFISNAAEQDCQALLQDQEDGIKVCVRYPSNSSPAPYDNSSTRLHTIPAAAQPVTVEEHFASDASPTLVFSPTLSDQSPAAKIGTNTQPTDATQDFTQGRGQTKSPMLTQSDHFAAAFEMTLTTMSSRFFTELETIRTTMMNKLAEEIEVARIAMKSQLATEFEAARVDMRNQLSEEFEETRTSMNNQFSEEFAATQASVEGIHLRTAEIERSIRGLWTTMAAERVNPMSSLRHANDDYGSRSRSRSLRLSEDMDDDIQEEVEEEGEEDEQGMDLQYDSDTMLRDTDYCENDNLQGKDIDNNDDEAEVMPSQSPEKRRPTFTWPSAAEYTYKQDLDELSDKIADLYEQIPESRLRSCLKGFEMLPRSASVRSVWKEWFSAKDDRPSIWSLDKHHRQWKGELKDQTVMCYYLKRIIVLRVMKEVVLLSETMGGGERRGTRHQQQQQRMALEARIEKALDIVQGGVAEARTI
ncbi:hypothetical protein BGZ47_003998 [Haplosporangium gracile]|nr:hypothetical protein BGZ47_003998 [Haplosporangium gracile]